MMPYIHALWYGLIAFAALGGVGALGFKAVDAWGHRAVSAADGLRVPFFGGEMGLWRLRPSGNTAFDEWRAGELARLEEARRVLEARHRDFEAFIESLRRAKDRETFERFLAQYPELRQAATIDAHADAETRPG